ncbi:MAG: hypothetical protein UU11_C0003G0027 [Parcubacteria group bacterium GW2011_GWF2_40_69]|nr:MAG: hypothetical protein UT68_C0006G0027 [Parcubacteria group bacterium GW2011_GWC2_40_10]KKR69033.1 MAG: hypothetical protein UU11_C0003G0027 [Parcubacteria group bacterium GW2011_GWF2_40_69]
MVVLELLGQIKRVFLEIVLIKGIFRRFIPNTPNSGVPSKQNATRRVCHEW